MIYSSFKLRAVMIFIMITAQFVMKLDGLCQNVQQRLTRGPESVPIPALRKFHQPHPRRTEPRPHPHSRNL